MDEPGDDALTEKEWREMRRRMTSLQFEPVPETPELVPRSLYGSGDSGREGNDDPHGEGADDDGESLYRDDAGLELGGGEDSPHAGLYAPMTLVMLEKSFTSEDDSGAQSPAYEPSRSSVSAVLSACKKATLPLTAASLKSSKRRSSTTSPVKKPRRSSATTHNVEASTASVAPVPPVDLADLDTVITDAQNQLRLTILSAVHETTARHEREATLERRKLEAAHANRVALLQSQLDELTTKTQTQQQEARSATQALERATRLMMKWKQREVGFVCGIFCGRGSNTRGGVLYKRNRWTASHSLRACFEEWKLRWQHRKQQHTQQHFATQFQKRQAQQSLLRQWKLVTQQQAFEKKLQAQRDEHSRAIDALKIEYETQLQQLKRELQSAEENAAIAQHGRQQLEGDLRQVFLRGVSAMNIEALTLFKTNHQQRFQQFQERGQQDQPPQRHHVHFQDENRRQDHGSADSNPVRGPTIGATGGESSEELPSEERMIPIKQPTEMVQDPVRQRLQALMPSETVPATAPPVGVMPSSIVANRLLKHAGSSEVVSTSTQPFTESTLDPSLPPAPPTAAIHGLRSAELVEAHQRLLHATAQSSQPATSPSIDAFSGRSLSPAQQRLKAQSSMQFNVEMELMRSSVAASAALSGRYLVAATSPVHRRAGSLRGSSLVTATSSLARRNSSLSSSSSSAKSRWRSLPS